MAKAAVFEIKHAPLSSDFGLQWATKLFGEEAIASLPKYERGPNKGKPKGVVHWRKCVEAGYSRDFHQFIQRGLWDAWIGVGMGVPRSHAMEGQWFGRTQSLAGHVSLMFEEGRARVAKERARDDADRERLICEHEARRAEREAERNDTE